ncbi:MAG: hypothetical protein V4702_04445 [Patescibacteria group bacterium]
MTYEASLASATFTELGQNWALQSMTSFALKSAASVRAIALFEAECEKEMHDAATSVDIYLQHFQNARQHDSLTLTAALYMVLGSMVDEK